MIPAYILHPAAARRRLEAPDPQSNVYIGAGSCRPAVWYTPKQYFLPR